MWKKIIIFVTIIFTLLCISIIGFAKYLDIDSYKSQILQKAKNALGRNIQVKGKIEIQFIPRPLLHLEDLYLSNLKGGTKAEMAHIKKISLSISIFPLLKKEIEFQTVRIEEADIFVEALPNGKKNWDFTAFKPDEASSPDLLFPPGSPLNNKFSKFSLNIKDFEILKLNLIYKDGAGVYDLKNLDAKITLYSRDLMDFLLKSSLSTEKAIKTFDNHKSGFHAKWPTEPLDVEFLNHFDMTVEAKCENIVKNSLKIEKASFKIDINKGILKIEELKGLLYEGKFKLVGHTDVKSHNNSHYQFSLKEGKLQQIIPPKRPIRIKNGLLDIQGELNTQGDSINSIISGIEGKVDLKVDNGIVSGLNLEALTSNLKKQNHLEGVIGLLTSSFTEGQSTFSISSNVIPIHKGIAQLENFKLESKEAEGNFKGWVDLQKYDMNVEGVFNLTTLKEIPPIKVNFQGPLDAPLCLIDSKDLQWYIVLSLLNIPRDGWEIFGMGASKTAETLGKLISKLLIE